MNSEKEDMTEYQKKILMKEKALSIAGWLLAFGVSGLVFLITLSFASNI